jgi:hypothetical protein
LSSILTFCADTLEVGFLDENALGAGRLIALQRLQRHAEDAEKRMGPLVY